MREGGVVAQGPLQAAEERALAEDLAESRLTGEPLPLRLRNFRPAVDRYVVSLGGVPAYMRRLAEIELETAEHEVRLEQAWRETAAESNGDAATFERRWRTITARWSFAAVNTLIELHNEYYPAESRLPMDPRTGDFVPIAGEPYRRRLLDSEWILARFPAELPSVRSAAASTGPGGDRPYQGQRIVL